MADDIDDIEDKLARLEAVFAEAEARQMNVAEVFEQHRARHMARFDPLLWLRATHPQHPTIQ